MTEKAQQMVCVREIVLYGNARGSIRVGKVLAADDPIVRGNPQCFRPAGQPAVKE